jgi:divalent metal cation (Fe/Co/Zn/Cd) transporter
MTDLSKEQITSRKKTLLIAFLLSAPGPLVTGLAVMSSYSSTQLADFIRRTVELAALFISWWVFRKIHGTSELGEANQVKLERAAGLSVAGAMVCSGMVMLIVAVSRLSAFEPGGNVYLGLTIAILGLVTNSYFYWRYTVMNREQYNSVIASQRDLYRAKAFVDFCVVTALAAVAIAPHHPATKYVDVMGSVIVAIYLLWTGLRMAQLHVGDLKKLYQSSHWYSRTASWLPIRKDKD